MKPREWKDIDGWKVQDERLWGFFQDAPPRKGAWRWQLAIDVRSWKPIAMWLVALGFLVAGPLTGILYLSGQGVIVLLAYLVMFRTVVATWRDTVPVRGKLRDLKPHPLMQRFRTGIAFVPMSDITLSVAVAVEADPAEAFLKAHGGMDVVVLIHPTRKAASRTFAPVLAFRPPSELLEPGALPAPREEARPRALIEARILGVLALALAVAGMRDGANRAQTRRALSHRPAGVCREDGDCGRGRVCVHVAHSAPDGPLGSDGLCAHECSASSDCAAGQKCVPKSEQGFERSVCVGAKAWQ